MSAENELTTDRSVYLQECSFAEKLLRAGASFPDQIFSPELQNFTFFNFDDFFTNSFFESLTRFVGLNGPDETFRLFTRRPDPEEYFYKNFDCYPILEGCILWTAEKYLASVFADPGDSPADAFAYNSVELILHSRSSDWCMYGNRDFEIAVLGAKAKSLIDNWHSVYAKCFDAEAAVDAVLTPAWASSQIPKQYIERLLSNYHS